MERVRVATSSLSRRLRSRKAQDFGIRRNMASETVMMADQSCAALKSAEMITSSLPWDDNVIAAMGWWDDGVITCAAEKIPQSCSRIATARRGPGSAHTWPGPLALWQPPL